MIPLHASASNANSQLKKEVLDFYTIFFFFSFSSGCDDDAAEEESVLCGVTRISITCHTTQLRRGNFESKFHFPYCSCFYFLCI